MVSDNSKMYKLGLEKFEAYGEEQELRRPDGRLF